MSLSRIASAPSLLIAAAVVLFGPALAQAQKAPGFRMPGAMKPAGFGGMMKPGHGAMMNPAFSGMMKANQAGMMKPGYGGMMKPTGFFPGSAPNMAGKMGMKAGGNGKK